ncbi:hypothetical protein RR42_s0653 [Cupriavidus basilensis]|uniref:Uncharacterized protein n=1 Tax=Cupriavidus basilensis TaxID=68895 RepID=A0A0C4YJX5_9BURK|nr:hypothetical protein RR42_s0653 [Cupriavidus basilensis]
MTLAASAFAGIAGADDIDAESTLPPESEARRGLSAGRTGKLRRPRPLS